MLTQAGTATGRALGTIAGANLAAFTAELGGKVSQQASSGHACLSRSDEGSESCTVDGRQNVGVVKDYDRCLKSSIER